MNSRIEQADVISTVGDYISSTMLVGFGDQSIEPDESLVQLGVVDSTGVLELVEFLHKRFGIDVKDEEITLENLDSLNAIGAFVRRKLEG